MSNKDILIEAIEDLREVRVKMYNDVEASVLEQFDEALLTLEEASHERPNQISREEIRELFFKGIGLMPVLAELIKILRDQC